MRVTDVPNGEVFRFVGSRSIAIKVGSSEFLMLHTSKQSSPATGTGTVKANNKEVIIICSVSDLATELHKVIDSKENLV